MTSADSIVVQHQHPDIAPEWKAFLAESNNGTLFHDLNFLAYHPANRFEVHHLLFRQNGKLIALLPAAVVRESDGRRFLKSPFGASIGGFVLPIGQQATVTLGLISCLKDYVTSLGLDGVEMRIGPNIYARYPNDVMSFVLAVSGFALTGRWLAHSVPLPSDGGEVLNRLVSKRRCSYVRSALRQGLHVVAGGVGDLAAFYRMLEVNRAKHGAHPTHSLSELERIFQLIPQSVRLFLCRWRGEIIAGTLVFELNDRVAYSFYPCHDERFENCRAATVVSVFIAEYYAARRFKYLDLGPTTFDDSSLNQGLARFKEELGGIGFCRDAWRWQRS